MTTSDWLKISPSRVLIDPIIPTQKHVVIDALVERRSSYCGDEFPHCVLWDGRLYLNDGHHRWVRDKLERRVTTEVRVAVPFAHFKPCS